MALTDAQAKIIAQNKKKREEEQKIAAAAAAKILASSTTKKSPSTILDQRASSRPYSPMLTQQVYRPSGALKTPLNYLQEAAAQKITTQDRISAAKRSGAVREDYQSQWQKNKATAAERLADRRERNSKQTLSEYDSKLDRTAQDRIRDYKTQYGLAREAGDAEGMRTAHALAEQVRARAGYSGGITGDEFLTAELTDREKLTLNQVGQNKLKMAKLAQKQAFEAKDAKALQEATAEMARIMNAPGYRNKAAVGDTDAHGRSKLPGSPDAQREGERAMAGLKAVGYGIPGSIGALGQVAGQAATNNVVDSNREYMQDLANRKHEFQAKIDAYENGEYIPPDWEPLGQLKSLLRAAENAERMLESGTVVDPDNWAYDLMYQSNEYAEEFLRGRTGLDRLLAETAMSMGQNLPGIALGLLPIPGAQAAGLGLMAAQAAGSRAYDLEMNGVDASTALLRGLGSGAVEGLTEKIPLDNLAKILKGEGGENVLRTVLTQMGMEGTEEGVAYVANFLLDKIAQDPNAEWSWEELGRNALMGALAGGAFATGGTIAADALGRRQTVQPTETEVQETSPATPAATQEEETDRILRQTAEAMLSETAQETAGEPVAASVSQAATVAEEQGEVQQKRTREAPAAVAESATTEQAKPGEKKVKLRRIESIPVEVETIQTKRITEPVVSPTFLSEVGKTLGQSGQKSMKAAWDGRGNQAQYAADFIRVYNQALTGSARDSLQASASMTEAQIFAAYNAGITDRQTNLTEAKRAAEFATVAGKDYGLDYDDYVKTSMDSTVADDINDVAKQLGLRVQMVDSVKDGDANADIQGSVVSIEKGNPHPVRFLFGHEMTHRVQELAPESYREFRDYVMQSPDMQAEVQEMARIYAANGVELTQEAAIDEVVADYAGRLIEDKQLMSQFVQQNKKNQSLLSRMLTALKDMAAKLTGKYKSQADDAVALLEKAVGEASKQAKKLEKNKNTAQTDGSETRFSIKNVNGRYSLKDSQGRALTAEQAEFFKDSQVRDENGDLAVVYHGSPADFNIFSMDYLGTNGTAEGYGFYFTDKRSVAENYSKGLEGQRREDAKGRLFEVYLNITKPLSDTELTIKRSDFKKFLKGMHKLTDEDGEPLDFLANYGDVSWEGLNKVLEYAMEIEYDGSDNDVNAVHSIINASGAGPEVVYDVLRKTTGHDGIIVNEATWGGDQTIYLAFHPDQVKNVDNRNPTDDPDIRYSLKGASSYTYQKLQEENRELRDRVDYWKGQTKRTQRVTTDKKAVDKAARELVSQYGADIDVAQIQGDLQGLYDYLASGRDGDNDLTYEAARERAVSIAEKLVYNAQAQDDGAYQQYGDLRKFLKETKLTVTEADSNDITDYADFRRSNLRYFNLSRGQHTNVDQVYKEMSERWPEFFDENRESNISDQLQHISDVMADIYNVTAYNPFSSYTREAIAGAANEIMEKFFDLPQTKATFADRQAAQLGREKARGKQRLQEEREKKNAQLEKLRRENRDRVAKAVQTERDRREKALAKVKAKYKAKDEAGRERRKARELRSKITRHANALRKKLIQPSDNQHIPEKLRTAVASVLNAINLESGYAYDPATMHQVVRKDGKSGGVVGKHVPKDQGTPTKRTQAFQELRLAYEKILSEADQQMVIDPDLMINIQEMEALKDTPIGDLSVSQLTTMWNTIKAVEASITSYNKMFGQQRFETIREVADGLKADNAGKRDRGDYRGPIGAMDKLINAGMLTPESFFHRLGKTGESLFRMLRNAQDKHIGIMQEAQKYTEMVVKDVDVRKLEKETHTFDVEDQQVTMTTAQIMSLYELMKRQQAIDHVVEGGIRVEAVSKGLKKKGMSEAIRVSPEKVGEILGVLTPKQIEIADGLQKFMGDRLSQLGNETSMEVYGYEKFKEKNYFPIKVDSNQTITDQAKDAVSATIAGRGFTKGTKPHANNALMVRNIFDVYADHVTDMATYSAWLAPMENLQRVFNFKFRDEKGNLTGTVKGLIHRIYGQNGEAYWKKLTEDLNNGVKGVNDNPFQALIGNYKASAIGANLRVFIQQPTSILRALDSISPADFMAGLTKANPNTWKKVKEYAPIAVWKDWGYFDADTGRQMKSILFGDDSRTAKVNNALMAPAGAMDSLAWSHIWNALEVETARKHKNLQKGSDAFYKKVAERFNEVVDHTQVVDGILQRSQVMRSPDGVTKMATSFMAEPTKIFNMFTTAAYDLRKSQDKAFRNKARKTMARTSVALFMSFVANAAAQSLVDAFRDDDKDEEYWEKFFQAFVGLEGDEETKMDKAKSIASGNMGKALNPFGYLPFVKDIVSLIDGYDVARMDMESISNVVSAVGYCVKSLNGEGKMTPANALLNLAAELSRFLGTPVSNIKRDVMAGINTWMNLTDNYKGQYAVAKVLYDINYTGNKGMFLDIAYLAWRDGDKETFIQISQDLMDAFPDKVNGETIESAMKSRTKKQTEKDMGYQPGQTLEDLIGILPEYAEEEEKEEEFSAKNLNAEEYNRFMQQRADSYRKYEDAVTGSSVWDELDDKAKDKVIGQLWKYAAQTALVDVSGGKFVMDESSMVKAKKLEEDHQVDPGIFFTLYGMTGVLESDKTVDGETISDSLGYKKLMAVRESGLLDGYTDDQQDAVYGALDISAKVQSMSEDSLNKLASEIDEKKNAPSFFADFPEEKKDDVKGLLDTLGSFQSDYDGNGKAIEGRGKQDKIKAELYAHYNNGEYTAHQCYLLWHEFYTSDKNNPWAYAKNG